MKKTTITFDVPKGSVYFYNKEAIDLNMIRLMGVNIKATETPIGFFGTGLKFAIATLLRNKQTITIIREGEAHFFDTVVEMVRDQEIEIVRMDGVNLGFTVDLGRNWKVWEAYRELHSNTLDEGGAISDEPPRPQDFDTIIVVEGNDFHEAYDDRGSIFLNPEQRPIAKWCEVEIHEGGNDFGFYRGIRAIKYSEDAAFTYNVTSALELTEDRTVKYDFYYRHCVERAISRLESYDLLERILTANNDFEAKLDFSSHSDDVSDEFLAVCGENRKNENLNKSALSLWKTKQPPKIVHQTVERLESHDDKLAQAFEFLKLMGCALDMGNIVVVERLHSGRYAEPIEGSVAVEKSVFEMDPFEIAKTIYPAVTCVEHDVEPFSVAYDEVVLDQFFELTKRVKTSVEERRIFKPSGQY